MTYKTQTAYNKWVAAANGLWGDENRDDEDAPILSEEDFADKKVKSWQIDSIQRWEESQRQKTGVVPRDDSLIT